MKTGVLVSGELGLNLLKHIAVGNTVIFVMTDKYSQTIIELCTDRNWAVYIGNPRNGRSKNFLEGKEIDVLISVNYLFLIEENLIELPKKLAFNIHGSLLPKYRGRTPHVWAIINNENVTGITAHAIEKTCDTGPIIEQIRVPIELDDTGSKILEKFKSLYVPLVDLVMEKIKNDKVQYVAQDHSKATFFGKRNPDDGKINWDWQKERIYNWVRAQAYPYPGAFTFHNGKKVIIDEIEHVDDSFDYTMPNGLILSVNPLRVKTPNGAIEIKKKRSQLDNLQKGDIFK